ncbi:MAG: (2Fe-2S) ferredoxin domain-containing protein [Catenulispora sp.]|nr:(2Fe-2S) ferredoxin domain-containing protein [Catenulispora sp.]NUR61029.1 (2Fe-2S) ferredoxin domain-containing protein [Catenulispora sp.]
MSGKKKQTAAAPAASQVTVCRGCCCGRTEKNPNIDHAAQLERLKERLGPARVRVSDCLDVCEQANVIVVSPSSAGRAAGGRPVWLGLVGDTEAIDDIADWIDAGGPGTADAPAVLDLDEFKPSRRVRDEAGFGDS